MRPPVATGTGAQPPARGRIPALPTQRGGTGQMSVLCLSIITAASAARDAASVDFHRLIKRWNDTLR
jgi:hypothetical protein